MMPVGADGYEFGPGALDPVCLVHGLRRSEHECLYCCLCFRSLTAEECHVLPDGSREDVCNECAALEAASASS